MQQERRPIYRTPSSAPQPRKDSTTYKKMSRKEVWVALTALVTALLLIVFFESHHRGGHASPVVNKSPQQSQSTPTTPSFDKKQYSLTDPTSIWVIVNKKRPLSPKNYAPADLTATDLPQRVPGNETMQMRSITASALTQLFSGAKAAGFNLMIASGYRSFSYQTNLYNGYVASIGQAEADKTSARPGYSEHQSGFAVDLEATTRKCELDACFGDTPEGQWIAANAYKYGFIIRYPKDKIGVTGYDYEPWHVRYVGLPLAAEMHNQNTETLEEFFGVVGGAGYSS